jgi:5-methylcytosine-specific restriction endonuclease McrA
MWRSHGAGKEFNTNDYVSPEQRKKRSSDALVIRHENQKKLREERVSNWNFDDLNNSEKRIRIFREQEEKCACCRIDTFWNGMELKFDLDHISGNRKDNSRDNLRLICPNCHSQTATYKSKNAGGKRYTDEDIINALKNNDSVYKALDSLGMNPHGGNYTRVRNIIKKYELKLSYLSI